MSEWARVKHTAVNKAIHMTTVTRQVQFVNKLWCWLEKVWPVWSGFKTCCFKVLKLNEFEVWINNSIYLHSVNSVILWENESHPNANVFDCGNFFFTSFFVCFGQRELLYALTACMFDMFASRQRIKIIKKIYVIIIIKSRVRSRKLFDFR